MCKARLLLVLAVGAVALTAAPAQAAWHVASSFGRRGVAGLPVREGGEELLYPPGPGDKGSLLASGPQGSLFVGGFAHSRRGAFLLARMSTRGTLVRGFGSGGVSTVPGIYALPQTPPRMFALAGGGVLVAGMNHAGAFAAAELNSSGHVDRGFGHDGVAQYALPRVRGRGLIAAVTLESDGDILIAYYPREAPQPQNQPRITAGLGEGALNLIRLLPSGALDRSFGSGGSLQASILPPASGEGLECGVSLAPDGSVALAYEQAVLTGVENATPAVEELTATGAAEPGFGEGGVALLGYTPRFEGVDSVIFGGLFALSGGAVEASFGGGGELVRFTPAGVPDPAFGASGRVAGAFSTSALALAPNGETFALHLAGSTLTLRGTLASGAPDPALGGARGMRFSPGLPRQSPERGPALELLAGDGTLAVLVGEDLVRFVS